MESGRKLRAGMGSNEFVTCPFVTVMVMWSKNNQ